VKEWYVIPGSAGENNHVRVTPVSDKVFFIVKIWVWNHCRGRGIGSHLLRTVCYDADQEGVMLRLTVSPFLGHLCLTEKQLIDWYARHGFYSVNEPIFMERLPKTPVLRLPGSRDSSPQFI